MTLEWFRHHKRIVYLVILPIIVISMVMLPYQLSNFGGVRGPSVTINDIDGKGGRKLSPTEVLTARSELNGFYNPQGRLVSEPTSDQVAQHLVFLLSAHNAGLEVGDAEAKDRIEQGVKDQIMMREQTQKDSISEEIYRKLLHDMKLSPNRFEAITREMATQQRYFELVRAYGNAADAEIFVEFMREKEVARLRYLTVKSEDFISKATVPSDEKITEFYEANKTKTEYKNVLFSKPKVSGEVLYMDIEKEFGKDMKATEDELKVSYQKHREKFKIPGKDGKPDTYKPFEEVKAELDKTWKDDALKEYYDNYKVVYYKVPPKAGEAPPEPGKETFKPFEEVKADVEKKWTDESKRNRPRERMQNLLGELRNAQKAHTDAEAKKPETDRKDFNVAEWAKSKNLIYWITPEQLEGAYTAGKKEPNAPDAQWVAQLFEYVKSDRPEMAALNESFRKDFVRVDVTEKGAASARVKSFSKEELKKPEEAKAAIIDVLKVREAIELAKKEAERIRGEWAEGKNLPSLEAMDEVRGDKSKDNAVLKKFFAAPKPVGEVIEVANKVLEAPPPPNPYFQQPTPPRTNFNEHFYAAIVVERELPTWDTFKQDSAFNREEKRDQIASSHVRTMGMGIQNRVRTMANVQTPSGMSGDPPLSVTLREANQE